ncbi:hypothetical protein CcaCcLH18_05048 [Colletotrichum camelliae]|nr:hypothetical protein CcaCcLH18_05048 [Colletotrichum camelliae]
MKTSIFLAVAAATAAVVAGVPGTASKPHYKEARDADRVEVWAKRDIRDYGRNLRDALFGKNKKPKEPKPTGYGTPITHDPYPPSIETGLGEPAPPLAPQVVYVTVTPSAAATVAPRAPVAPVPGLPKAYEEHPEFNCCRRAADPVEPGRWTNPAGKTLLWRM